jgi:hypothetical protein
MLVKANRREFMKSAAAGVALGAIGAQPSGADPAPGKNQQEGSTMSDSLDLTCVAYCGLYCKLCVAIGRIPKQCDALLDTLVKDGWDHWHKEFLQALRKTSKIGGEGDLQGCRGYGCSDHDPNCEIRKCAQQRKVNVCSSCSDYPCDRVKALAKRYPLLLVDGARQKEIGFAKWIEEQETRCKTGFCYSDINY